MTKVNSNNGNEAKPYFFHDTYSNLTSCFFLSKNIKLFQWLSKSKFPSFMIKMNPNTGNKTKSDAFHETYSNPTSIFHQSQITKIFQWLLQLTSFNFIARVSTNKWNKIKWNTCKSDSIVPYIQISTISEWILEFIYW